MGNMPEFAGKNWGQFKLLLENALTPERPATDFEVRGVGNEVLTAYETGDPVVAVSPGIGTSISDPATPVIIKVARYKLPNYEDPDNPIELWAATQWLTQTDPTVSFQRIVKLPAEVQPYPPPLEWWVFVLSLVKEILPDGSEVNRPAGSEVPVGATLALFVTDPPGGSLGDIEIGKLLHIANAMVGLIGLPAFLRLVREWQQRQ